MREYGVPALAELADDDGLADVLHEKAATNPAGVVFSRKTDDGWQDIAYGEFTELVRGVAKGLLAAGIAAGDRVLVLGRTGYDWSVVDFALLSVGAVSVPIYPTASAEQVRHIAKDSDPVACFTETADQRDLFVELTGAALADRAWLLGESFPELVAQGESVPDAEHERRRKAVRANDVATIVYTSGTTGLPKGCVLTHRNIFAAAANVVELLSVVFRGASGEGASTLLFLPLAHVYGRVTQFGCVWAGVRTGLVTSAADLLGELPVFRPTFLVGVPYLLEKIRKAAKLTVGAGDAAERYAAAESAAIEYGHARRHRVEPAAEVRTAFAEFDADVYPKLRGLLGGRLAHVIAGGASLEPSTGDFFAGLGVEVIGAYGLTEATSTVSMSAPGANRANAVGRPVPGSTVSISDDGEILVRGDVVFPGYWPEAAGGGTARPDDWLATGDLGRLDDDGFLHITGRRKEIIVTSGGKNVAPAPIEDRIRLHPLVSNCMLVGEGRPYVTALITLDPLVFPSWAAARGLDVSTVDWTVDARVLDELRPAVDAANALVSQAESVRRFRVLPRDFSVGLGEVTASLRLRRAVIEDEFAEEIAALYAR